jgi:hypothetical protein
MSLRALSKQGFSTASRSKNELRKRARLFASSRQNFLAKNEVVATMFRVVVKIDNFKLDRKLWPMTNNAELIPCIILVLLARRRGALSMIVDLTRRGR